MPLLNFQPVEQERGGSQTSELWEQHRAVGKARTPQAHATSLSSLFLIFSIFSLIFVG